MWVGVKENQDYGHICRSMRGLATGPHRGDPGDLGEGLVPKEDHSRLDLPTPGPPSFRKAASEKTWTWCLPRLPPARGELT